MTETKPIHKAFVSIDKYMWEADVVRIVECLESTKEKKKKVLRVDSAY